jgi:hypothetical protein
MKNADLTRPSSVPDRAFRIVRRMTRERVRPTLLALVLTAALAGTTLGCAGDGEEGSEQQAAEAPARAAPTTTGETEEADEADEEEQKSPLDAFLSVDDPTAEEAAQQLRREEQLVVACMRREGFRYVARDEVAAGYVRPGPYALPADEFSERYGYGITTIDERKVFEEVSRADPNEEIMRGLSPSALRAYWEALHGAAAAAEKWGEAVPADAASRPGCRPTAQRAVYGDREKKALPPDLDAFREEMNALWDRIDGDPRVRAAEQAWGDCMADAGYPELQHPDDARTEITRRLWALYGEELPEWAVEQRRGRRKDIPLPGPAPRPTTTESPAEPAPDALAELREYELGVARADRGCRPDYEETLDEVQAEVEQAFIDANRAELERFREAVSLEGGP